MPPLNRLARRRAGACWDPNPEGGNRPDYVRDYRSGDRGLGDRMRPAWNRFENRVAGGMRRYDRGFASGSGARGYDRGFRPSPQLGRTRASGAT